MNRILNSIKMVLTCHGKFRIKAFHIQCSIEYYYLTSMPAMIRSSGNWGFQGSSRYQSCNPKIVKLCRNIYRDHKNSAKTWCFAQLLWNVTNIGLKCKKAEEYGITLIKLLKLKPTVRFSVLNVFGKILVEHKCRGWDNLRMVPGKGCPYPRLGKTA